MMSKIVIIFLFSYILGAVPFGVIVGKLWRGVDIRNYGSGNIGATNVLRSLGKAPAAVVCVLDMSKGLFPVLIARHIAPDLPWVAATVAFLAVMGHSFSVFLKFKGGKGAATSLGVLIGLDYRLAAVTLFVWLVLVAITRYVSLASIIGAITVPVMTFVLHLPLAYKIFGLVVGLCVIAKHHSNISRLINGTESRIGQKVNIEESAENGKGRIS